MSLRPDNWQLIRAIFEGALLVPRSLRGPHVAAACAADAALRAEVDTLLEAHERAEGFLSTSAAWTTIAQGSLSLEGCQLGPYVLLARLASGGMGEVYQARDNRLNRTVAIKVLRAHVAADPVANAWFEAEARAVAALNHPHICTLYDVGEAPIADLPDQGCVRFLVMEYVEGTTLAELGELPLDPSRVARIGSQASEALEAAHARGIVHRDIKPSNIMLTPGGLVKLLDFGIATLGHDDAAVIRGSSSSDATASIVGTALYMSPEQLDGGPVSSATDVFSLGIVLYWLLTGRHPFAGELLQEPLGPRFTGTPLPPHRWNPNVPPVLDSVTLATLEKDPSRRPDAGTLHRALAGLAGVMDSPGGRGLSQLRRRHLVGRETERHLIDRAFAEAAAGHPRLVTVSGEPGIGKTTFVETFLSDVDVQYQARVARGRCSERLAGSEAYLPIIEILEDLLKDGDRRPDTELLMRQVAPTWYAQIDPAGDLATGPADAPHLRTASQERMKREIRGLLATVSRGAPLVLFLDDLHWSDVSTVDLLGYLCRHLDSMRLLIVVTYRPTELLLVNHPFVALKLDLSAQGLCLDVPLAFLTRSDATRYLDLEFPGHRFPPELAAAIHDRTEGSPLFMTDVVRDLHDRRVLVPTDTGWDLGQSIASVARGLPASVRSMIERKIGQLSDDDRLLLVCAAVQGHAFDSAVVAAVLGRSSAEVEERVDVLERIHGLVSAAGEVVLPDGTVTLRFRFVHVLYQNALYGSLLATRRATLSAAVADALIGFHGAANAGIATEVAVLLEAARDHSRAVQYFLLATQHALRVFAFTEAAALAERGLRLIPGLASSAGRNDAEMKLQIALGTAAVAIGGYAAPEVERAYGRARELCRQAGDSAELAAVLFGLYVYYLVFPEHRTSLELGDQVMALAAHEDRTAVRIQAWLMQGMTRFWMGSIEAAGQRLERAITLHDAHRQSLPAADPLLDHGVLCRRYHAVTLWLQGRPEQAVCRMAEALDTSRALNHPLTLASTLSFASMLHYFRRDVAASARAGTEAVACAREFALRFWLGFARAVRGWAVARLAHESGKSAGWDEGLAEVRESLEDLRGAGARTFCSVHAALLAETYMLRDRFDEATTALNQGLALAAQIQEGVWVAELHRLHGELSCRAGTFADAARHFSRGIDASRERQQRALELRGLISLYKLARSHPDAAPADDVRRQLARTCAEFTEGLDSPELLEARTLVIE